jgi:hypothetical protein
MDEFDPARPLTTMAQNKQHYERDPEAWDGYRAEGNGRQATGGGQRCARRGLLNARDSGGWAPPRVNRRLTPA